MLCTNVPIKGGERDPAVSGVGAEGAGEGEAEEAPVAEGVDEPEEDADEVAGGSDNTRDAAAVKRPSAAVEAEDGGKVEAAIA
jgi:hypothetical protein